jgi:hypothetical protein
MFDAARSDLLRQRGLLATFETTVEGLMRQQGMTRREAQRAALGEVGVTEREVEEAVPGFVSRMNTANADQRRETRRRRAEDRKRRKDEAKSIAMAHLDGKLVISPGDASDAESLLKRRRNEWWRKKQDQRAGVDDYDAIRWVAEVFADDEVGRTDAPSEMAWSLLAFARSSPANTATFWGTLFKSIALPKRSDIEEMQRNRAGTRHIMAAIDEARASYRDAVGTDPPSVEAQ